MVIAHCFFICVLLLVLLEGRAGGAAEEFSLLRAIDYALKYNREIELDRLAIESTHVTLADTRSSFLPVIRPHAESGAGPEGLHTEYGFSVAQRTTWGTAAELRADVSREKPTISEPYYRSTLVIALEQPLLRRLGPLTNREILTRAESRYAAALRQAELRKAEVVARVVALHEQMVAVQRQLGYARSAVERLEHLTELTRARERQGRASRLDTLRAETKLGSERLRLSALEEQSRSLANSFADLLGLPPQIEVAVIPGPRFEVQALDEANALETAFSNRLDFAQALQDVADAGRSVQIARVELLPDLNLRTRYEKTGYGQSYSEAVRWDDDSWFVGLSLSVSLPRYHSRYALRQTVLSHETAQLRLEALKSTIRREVLDAILAWRRTQAQLPVAEQNYLLARKRTILARRLFETGKTDSFAVADAEDELRRAEENWLNAETQQTIATCRLLHATGTLIQHPDSLKPPAVGKWVCPNR